MTVILKVLETLVLVAIAWYCVFGFLASAEAGPRGAIVFRLIYGTVGLACVAAIVAIWFVKRRRD